MRLKNSSKKRGNKTNLISYRKYTYGIGTRYSIKMG